MKLVSCAFAVPQGLITRSTPASFHFNRQQKVPLNKVIYAQLVLFRYDNILLQWLFGLSNHVLSAFTLCRKWLNISIVKWCLPSDVSLIVSSAVELHATHSFIAYGNHDVIGYETAIS